MLIEYKFTSQSGQEIEGLRTELDRNYADEETALVFIPNMESDTGGYFELNLRKDEQGHLTGGGYVCEYDSEDDSQESYINTEITLEVTEHDFDEPLAKANEMLKPHQMEIVLEYDGEMYWSVGLKDYGRQRTDWFSEGDFDHEVAGEINECLVHALARAENPELWQEPQTTAEKIRSLWESLSAEEQVDMLVEFYQDLMDADKDRFLEETGNS